MNLSTASRTFQLLSRLLDPRSSTEPFVPSAGDKRALPLRPAAQPFPRALPEACGVSSRHIRKFLEELSDSALHMQTAMVLRHGQVLCEAAFGSQTLLAPTYTFSACKSVVSLAIGLLADDGLLAVTDKVEDIFEVPGLRRRLKDLTVEDLLTMRAGLLFTEAEALTETDWVRRFLSAAQKSEPGADFFYNSLNTYLLSAIVCRKTGRGLTDLLQERLFTPMGITDVLWEKCPMGVEKGGWGLYIRPEDAAKLGQLVMDGGVWRGQRLLSGEYLIQNGAKIVMVYAIIAGPLVALVIRCKCNIHRVAGYISGNLAGTNPLIPARHIKVCTVGIEILIAKLVDFTILKHIVIIQFLWVTV